MTTQQTEPYDPEEFLNNFVEMTAQMRQSQKSYFATRDAAQLQLAKELELRIDAAIASHRDRLSGQGTLL